MEHRENSPRLLIGYESSTKLFAVEKYAVHDRVAVILPCPSCGPALPTCPPSRCGARMPDGAAPRTAARLRLAREMLRTLSPHRIQGRVAAFDGLTLDIAGLSALVSRGDRLEIELPGRPPLSAEVISVSAERGTRAMAFDSTDGVRLGSPAVLAGQGAVAPGPGWLGRVLDPLGAPMDGGPPPPPGPDPVSYTHLTLPTNREV